MTPTSTKPSVSSAPRSPWVFLIIIGLINLGALMGSYQVRREAQTGAYDEDALEDALNPEGHSPGWGGRR
jgi:hypothetical protein